LPCLAFSRVPRERVILKMFKRFDTYVQSVEDENTRTMIGGFWSLIIVPIVVAAYLGLILIVGKDWVTTTSTIKTFGDMTVAIKLECQNPNGCYYVTVQMAEEKCPATEFAEGSATSESPPTSDWCTVTSGNNNNQNQPGNNNPPPNNNNNNNNNNQNNNNNNGRRLQDPPPGGRECKLATCGEELSDMCVYIDPDPINAPTFAWQETSGNGGANNFGMKLKTWKKNKETGIVEQYNINLHKGMLLLSLLKRVDPRMVWEEGSGGSGDTVFEWSVLSTETTGESFGDSYLCVTNQQGVTGFDPTGQDTYYSMKLAPFPTYTEEVTAYPNPILEAVAEASGIMGLASSVGGWIVAIVLMSAGIKRKKFGVVMGSNTKV